MICANSASKSISTRFTLRYLINVGPYGTLRPPGYGTLDPHPNIAKMKRGYGTLGPPPDDAD